MTRVPCWEGREDSQRGEIHKFTAQTALCSSHHHPGGEGRWEFLFGTSCSASCRFAPTGICPHLTLTLKTSKTAELAKNVPGGTERRINQGLGRLGADSSFQCVIYPPHLPLPNQPTQQSGFEGCLSSQTQRILLRARYQPPAQAEVTQVAAEQDSECPQTTAGP